MRRCLRGLSAEIDRGVAAQRGQNGIARVSLIVVSQLEIMRRRSCVPTTKEWFTELCEMCRKIKKEKKKRKEGDCRYAEALISYKDWLWRIAWIHSSSVGG
ncbi:hypothetical protein Tco_1304549 [Tanacetum coccineum]